MKSKKKLKLNTKKVVILSEEQQNNVQGGYRNLTEDCGKTWLICPLSTNPQCPQEI